MKNMREPVTEGNEPESASGTPVLIEHGPAINRAPAFGKRFQIRHGPGVMPPFD